MRRSRTSAQKRRERGAGPTPAAAATRGHSDRKRGKSGPVVAEEADQAGAPSAEDDFAETLQLSDEQGAEGADGAGYDSSSGSGEVYDSGSGEEDSEGEDDDDAELLEDSDVEGTSDAEEAGATAGSASAERGGEESDPYMRGLKRGKDGQLYIVDEEEFEAARKEQAQKTLPVDPVRTMLLNADDVSSDEEEGGNTIGNVPLWWYGDQEHLGYDVSGKKVMKKGAQDRIDQVLAAKDDPNHKWTVFDEKNDEKIVLSARELVLLRRILSGKAPHPEHNPTPEYIDFNTGPRMLHPVINRPPRKAAFVPSKWETMKINKIAAGIEEGRIKLDQEEEKEEVYMLWREDNAPHLPRHLPRRLPPPKMTLPGHAESYNPPAELLPTEQEKKEWEEMDKDERPYNFMPTKFGALRRVPLYKPLVHERFERCMDLHLAPRLHKEKLDIDPESLVPQLPQPHELRPFPTTPAVHMRGHGDSRVRGVALSPSGQYAASVAEDRTLRVWESDTGRCLRTFRFEEVPVALAWNPNPHLHIIAVASGRDVLIVQLGTASEDDEQATEELLAGARADAKTSASVHADEEGDAEEEEEEDEDEEEEAGEGEDESGDRVRVVGLGDRLEEDDEGHAETLARRKNVARWREVARGAAGKGAACGFGRFAVRLAVTHATAVTAVSWHRKGDYLAAVCPKARSRGVVIHQLSRRRSQAPLSRNVGAVQKAVFHPTKPMLFVATQTHVRIYDLVAQGLSKKLQSGAKWISDLHPHPSGDHVLLGSYDRRVCWFDLDLGSTPFKTLRYHKEAVRAVRFHGQSPLMASASDDGTIQVFHARVFSDLIRNPMIVPVKVLRGHKVTGGFGVLDIAFHATRPWLLSGGADGQVILYQDLDRATQ